jgi:peptidyl-tRNA hydrolase, PTH1 family
MWLVVGLGNPGKQYENHRHNVGFMVVEALAERLGADTFKEKFRALQSRARKGSEELVLLMPQTFMNLSGESVQPAAAFFKIPTPKVLVVHDELDVPFGELRLKTGGGHAGHNGLRSIIGCLGSPEFHRLRVGVGRPPPGFRGEVADYVLSSFDANERAELGGLLQSSVDAIVDVVDRGMVAATNRLNTKTAPRSGAKAPGAVSPRGKPA